MLQVTYLEIPYFQPVHGTATNQVIRFSFPNNKPNSGIKAALFPNPRMNNEGKTIPSFF